MCSMFQTRVYSRGQATDLGQYLVYFLGYYNRGICWPEIPGNVEESSGKFGQNVAKVRVAWEPNIPSFEAFFDGSVGEVHDFAVLGRSCH